MSEKIKREFQSKERKWFMEYIPETIYLSLTPEERTHVKRYRDYHRYMDGRLRKIENLQKEMMKMKKEIKGHREKVFGVYEDGVQVTSGFKDKMLLHYDFVKHLDKNIRLDCWMELRDKSSKSYKQNSGIPFTQNVKKTFITKSEYNGVPLKKIIRWYSIVRTTIEGKKTRKNIYCGDEKMVRELLRKLMKVNIDSRGTSFLRIQITELTKQYTRHYIYNSNWKTFKLESHNLTKMVEWGISVGKRERKKWSKNVFENTRLLSSPKK